MSPMYLANYQNRDLEEARDVSDELRCCQNDTKLNVRDQNLYFTAMNEVKQCLEDNWDRVNELECHHRHLYELF